MSALTRQAFEDALREHVADECNGALVVDWFAAVAAVSAERADSTWYVRYSSDSPAYRTSGLVHYAVRRVDREWDAEMDEGSA